MHAEASAGGHDGFKRRRVCCLFQLWAVHFGGRARGKGSCQLEEPSTFICQPSAKNEKSQEKPREQSMNKTQEVDVPDFSKWSCPLPLAGYPTIVMGHGGGGKLGNELVEHLFLPAFRNPALENLGDAALFNLGSGQIAMSTDS